MSKEKPEVGEVWENRGKIRDYIVDADDTTVRLTQYCKNFSVEQRKKLSERMKNTDLTYLHKAVSKALKGRKKSEEHRKKIGQSQFGQLNHAAKKIICVETGKVFNCIRDVERELEIKNPNITKACKEIHRTCKGFHWRYFDDWKESLRKVGK